MRATIFEKGLLLIVRTSGQKGRTPSRGWWWSIYLYNNNTSSSEKIRPNTGIYCVRTDVTFIFILDVIQWARQTPFYSFLFGNCEDSWMLCGWLWLCSLAFWIELTGICELNWTIVTATEITGVFVCAMEVYYNLQWCNHTATDKKPVIGVLVTRDVLNNVQFSSST